MGEGIEHRNGTDFLGILSFGFFLMLFGIIWMLTPNYSEEVVNFFKDFHLEHITENIALPAPQHNHPTVYSAAMYFCLVYGVFSIVILALRFFFHESLNRKAETISGIAFWLNLSFFLNMLANESIGWFGFLAGVIISVGLSIIVRSLVKLLGRSITK
ncbi:MAG: hypothetical protein QW667_06470 [Candidatus Bathyarchaeia archaeon]